MKKFITIIFATIVAMMAFSINANAQLSITNVDDGYKTVGTFGMGTCEIRFLDGAFVLFGVSNNRFEHTMHSIYLGETKESAILSLEDLSKLKRGSEKIITLIGYLGKETTLYKKGGGSAFKTEGIVGESYALNNISFTNAIEKVKAFEM